MNKRRFAASLAAVLLPASALAVAAPDAADAAGGCITKREYSRIRDGQKIKTVRKIVGASGRVTSSTNFGDGDKWKTIDFRACRGYGAASISFESTEREVYVPNVFCYDEDGDGYEETCEDYGYTETRYSNPLIVTSKSAYWY